MTAPDRFDDERWRRLGEVEVAGGETAVVALHEFIDPLIPAAVGAGIVPGGSGRVAGELGHVDRFLDIA